MKKLQKRTSFFSLIYFVFCVALMFYSCKAKQILSESKQYLFTWNCVNYYWNPNFPTQRINAVQVKLTNYSDDTIAFQCTDQMYIKRYTGDRTFCINRYRDTLNLNLHWLENQDTTCKVAPNDEISFKLSLGFIKSSRLPYINALNKKEYYELIDSILVEGDLFYNPLPSIQKNKQYKTLLNRIELIPKTGNCTYDNHATIKNDDNIYDGF